MNTMNVGEAATQWHCFHGARHALFEFAWTVPGRERDEMIDGVEVWDRE